MYFELVLNIVTVNQSHFDVYKPQTGHVSHIGGGIAGLSQSAWSLTELKWKQGSGVFLKLLPVVGFCAASQTMLRTMSRWNPSGLLWVSITSPPGWARKEFSRHTSRRGLPRMKLLFHPCSEAWMRGLCALWLSGFIRGWLPSSPTRRSCLARGSLFWALIVNRLPRQPSSPALLAFTWHGHKLCPACSFSV